MNIRSIPVYATLCTALLGAGCATDYAHTPRPYASPEEWTRFYNSIDEQHLNKKEQHFLNKFNRLSPAEQEQEWQRALDAKKVLVEDPSPAEQEQELQRALDAKKVLVEDLSPQEKQKRSLKDIIFGYYVDEAGKKQRKKFFTPPIVY
ncbi:MAG TPA: hypothetical protein VJK03_02855 [Candidatus Nanoarchaeia archaeon]|nr:hypothetical protein [Candidatus Nanoarchaeia archaeon]